MSQHDQEEDHTVTMFYEGELQGGIAKAVQESKSVVCFVSGTCSIFPTGSQIDLFTIR